jgi:VWFA-related protein
MKLSVAALLAVLLLPLAAGYTVQGQQPIFRAQVELVEIDAIVTDASGNPVEGLTAGDFEIVENGKPQTVAAFSAVNIPIERDYRPLYSPTAIEPDVLTNQGAPGRTYLILLDDFHPYLALRTRLFVRQFIERHLGANDVAAISYLGTGADNSQDFTSSKRVLLRAIDRFGGNVPSTETVSLFAEVYDNIKTSSPHTIDLAATLRADDGRVLATVTGQRSSSELRGAAGGFGFTAGLPLTGVTPGRYVIHVEARANTGERPTVSRDVPIVVR